jgi:hypothetical protein
MGSREIHFEKFQMSRFPSGHIGQTYNPRAEYHT